jgi:hypothetical protein
MDGHGFDDLVRQLAPGRSRRSVLRGAIGGGVALAATKVSAGLAAPAEKVLICHWSEDLGYYKLISVSGNAVEAHRAQQHGMNIIGPDFTSDATCGANSSCVAGSCECDKGYE